MHFVVGTAGHVDHGKTALVRALTGIDCDRLPEEKTRGITIELGFAPWRLDDETTASVVDVPGHERFVRTMVAGASGIDCVVLVVAADDGVMPQTREHLAICELLGVRRGVVAVTKADLAESDLLALVEDDVRAATRGTALEGAEVVRCSATRGTGLAELTKAVARACASLASSAAARSGPAFFAVDRAFAKAGAGKIVTGTLTRGALAVGDELEAIRGDVVTPVRVRTLEVHGTATGNVVAASRIAASLRGDDLEVIDRGTVLATPASVRPTRTIEASLDLLAASGVEPLAKRTALRIHLGATAFDAWATLLEEAVLAPGARALARISSAVPFASFVGQRFVVRRSDGRLGQGERTVGGGVVLDPLPTKMRWRRRERPLHYETTDAVARALRLVAESRWAGAVVADLLRRAPASDDLPAAIEELARRGEIVTAAERWFARAALLETKTAISAALTEGHRQKPLVLGVAGAELATRVAPRYRLLAAVALAALVAEGAVLEESGGLYRSRAHAEAAALAGERQKVLAEVGARFARGGLTPPLDEVARTETGLAAAAFKDAIAELRRAGAIRLVGGLHFDMNALAELREKVRTWFASHELLTPVEFKELCGGITRKHAIPLLEWLDGEGLTTRRGDARAPGPALARTDPSHSTSR